MQGEVEVVAIGYGLLILGYLYFIKSNTTPTRARGRFLDMPNATASQDTERHELTTCEGGFVELRRMTYGEFIKRREMLSGMRLEGKGKEAEAVMQLANEKVTQFEFSRCIVDHNLEDENGRQLKLGKPQDFNRLDTRIGQEIGELIDKMNQLHNDDEEGYPAGEAEAEGN